MNESVNYLMSKSTLIIVIDDLGRGGAEILLMGILPELNKKFTVIIVTLSEKFEFEPGELICTKIYSLGFSGKKSFLPAILKLKKIIKENRPQLVHAHLLKSSIVARAACPSHIPLVYTLHTIMSKDAFDNSRLYKLMEEYTIRKNHSVIAVSQAVLDDYKKTIDLPGRFFILKNYVEDTFLQPRISHTEIQIFKEIKLLAVGNIKPVKNYEYLLKAFEHLQSLPVSLHIYGQGEANATAALQKHIDSKNLNIELKGGVDNIAALLPAYDLFVMSSLYEGFGIAPVEAMGMGLPLLLSDIPVFKEITYDNALFFNLDDPMDFVKLIQNISENKYDLKNLSARGIQLAKEHYSKEIYLEKLFLIYDQLTESTEE